MTAVRRTHRWRGVVAIALLASAVGVFATRPLVLLAGAVGAGFAAYPWLRSPPSVELDVTRSLTPTDPAAGDDVTVTVRVRNVGDSTLSDLRIVDGVPPMLTVSNGTPRHAAFLRPGSTTEFEYDVEAAHGRHQFDPATVVARDITGSTEVETSVSADAAIECAAAVPEVPLREQTTLGSGRVLTPDGGSGIEFHKTREYNTGDPMSRIDWKRRAKTGELTTIEFREERPASVLLCLDARACAYRAASEDEPNAVACSREAISQLLTAVGNGRDAVGLAAVGRELCWHRPGRGTDHLADARQLLASHRTFSTVPPAVDADWSPSGQFDELRRRLGDQTQVFLFSPLTDEEVASFALELENSRTAVTVVCPDVTTAETPGSRFAAVEREERVRRLRGGGVTVVPWSPSEPLGPELLRAKERGL
ncbi:conserved repeat domain-containing protein [Halopelagius inordinatus]|uniref:Conserved repeat domain-containing protein n=1 Tax=Halopelagius inordinatus TaxID=553467 RepID=A0A1I2LHN9_9EURY|nr:DUF58 domain-containing protein [Halopelagius inordinatus]SFF77979.1 conserved repeat domain-containing protein [Halopelagius inordinatus]